MTVILLSAAVPRARGASVDRACSAPSRVGAAASGRGCRGRRILAAPADSPPPSEDPAARDASSTASSSGGQAEDTFESGLNKLWRNDAEFFGARVWQDAERTVRGLRFSTELLKSAFGQGQRPKLVEQMERLREELQDARLSGHLSQVRLKHTTTRLQEMEAAVRSVAGVGRAPPAAPGRIETAAPSRTGTAVRNFWYPVAHSSQVGKDTLMPFDLFDRSWCLFRNEAGLPAVVLDECAHRACPLSLGKNVGGRVQCPYHGWEFNASGVCEKMPSCAFLKGVAVPAMPAVEQDGLIWAWAGDSVPALQLPRFAPPPGFRLVAEVTLEVEAQWGAMLEGLLDIAQRPELRLQQRAAAAAAASGGALAELGTEAEECASDDGVECLDPWTPGREVAQALAKALRSGGWDHEVLDASFEPPCAVLTSSTLVGSMQRRLQQLHIVLPGRPGRCRVLFRIAADYSSGFSVDDITPGGNSLWQALSTALVTEEVAFIKARSLSRRLVPADQQRVDVHPTSLPGSPPPITDAVTAPRPPAGGEDVWEKFRAFIVNYNVLS